MRAVKIKILCVSNCQKSNVCKASVKNKIRVNDICQNRKVFD